MSRTILAVLAALSLAGLGLALAAAPTTLVIDDSGMDYSDSDDDPAYVDFSLDGDQLVVLLTHDADVSTIPEIEAVVPGPEKEDIAEDDIDPTLADVKEITTTNYGPDVLSIEVTHPDASLATVTSSYLTALEGLGFTITDQSGIGVNIDTYTLTMGESNVKLVFHRIGRDITAYLTGV